MTVQGREHRAIRRIALVNTADVGGGAERVASDLFQSYQSLGYEVRFVVGKKRTQNPHVLRLHNTPYRSLWTKGLWYIASHLPWKSNGSVQTLRSLLLVLARPHHWRERRRGHETFDYPATQHLLDVLTWRPDVVHLHNLHGGYFDLRYLPILSRRVPLFITLHDMWMFTGHCAHSFGCERWRTGCGACPDLTIHPPLQRDGTQFNLARKKEIYRRSILHVASPSHWLLDKAKTSVLAAGAHDFRVLPNGVDTTIFRPGSRKEARQQLGLPEDCVIVLSVGNRMRRTRWRDYGMAFSVGKTIAEHEHRRIIMVFLGEDAELERHGNLTIIFERTANVQRMARYYQAADVYLHPALVDNFPLSVLEAMASGTPVVATKVGGIPEQVVNGTTGFLVPPRDVRAAQGAVLRLLQDDGLWHRLSTASATRVLEHFTLAHQTYQYLRWYQEVLDRGGIKGRPL